MFPGDKDSHCLKFIFLHFIFRVYIIYIKIIIIIIIKPFNTFHPKPNVQSSHSTNPAITTRARFMFYFILRLSNISICQIQRYSLWNSGKPLVFVSIILSSFVRTLLFST
jgi:hypothetical protein